MRTFFSFTRTLLPTVPLSAPAWDHFLMTKVMMMMRRMVMMAMMFYFILQLHSAINYGMKFSYCKSYLLCSTKHAQATEHTGQRKKWWSYGVIMLTKNWSDWSYASKNWTGSLLATQSTDIKYSSLTHSNNDHLPPWEVLDTWLNSLRDLTLELNWI